MAARVLLDTHLVIWAATGERKLPKAVETLRFARQSELLFSVVTIWEVAIKTARGHPAFQIDPAILRRGLLDNGWTELIITSDHAIAAAALPLHHRDPFDRLLLGQAMVEDAQFMTSDRMLGLYGEPVRLV